MSQTTSPPPFRTRTDVGSDAARLLVAVVAGVGLGMLTFASQSSLPDWVDSISNSASGWALVAVLVVVLTTTVPWRGAVLAVLVMVLLNVGYYVAADLDGLYYYPWVWVTVAVVAGPFIGAAAAVLREGGRRSGIAHGFLGGLLVAECVVAYLTVLATTSWVYWTLVGIGGLVLVARGLSRTADRRATGAAFVVTVGGALLAGRALESLMVSWY